MEKSTSPSIVNKKESLAIKYLAKTIEFDIVNTSALDLITKGISILTGKPQNTITQTSKLSNLGLTPTKRAQLRAYLNQYIQKQGSNSFITVNEMDAASNVQDLNQLVETKTP